MALLKRQLHLWHRRLGICVGLLVLLWFCSGVVMMYVPYPALTEQERAAWLEPVEPSAVRISAADAWAALAQQGVPGAVRLSAVTGRPAYHFLSDGRWTSVWADTGAAVQMDGALAAATVRRVLRRMALNAPTPQGAAPAGADGAPSRQAHSASPIPAGRQSEAPLAVEAIDGDQWTFGPLKVHKPLYRVAASDPAGTVLYVSGRTGELVRDTTRSERAWNWAGSVIHWIYFTPLRTHGEPWRQVVMWTSGVAFVLVLSGMVLGILRLRLKRRYGGGRLSPYKGWASWHHWLGLGIGTLTITWLFSGWLSVTPFGLFSSPGLSEQERLAFTGGALGSADLSIATGQLLRGRDDVVEAEWRRVDGRLYLSVLTRTGRALVDAQSGEVLAGLSRKVLQHAVQAMRPGVPLQAEMLTSGDDYYYSHHQAARLPVLRARFQQPEEPVVYVSAAEGKIVEYVDSASKWNRWLFNALHQLDLPPLRIRPIWDVLVISLCALGAMLAATGLVLGWRRLRR